MRYKEPYQQTRSCVTLRKRSNVQVISPKNWKIRFRRVEKATGYGLYAEISILLDIYSNSSKCNYAIPYGGYCPKTCTSATIKQSASSGEISLRKTCNAQKAISSKVVCSTKTNILWMRKWMRN